MAVQIHGVELGDSRKLPRTEIDKGTRYNSPIETVVLVQTTYHVLQRRIINIVPPPLFL